MIRRWRTTRLQLRIDRVALDIVRSLNEDPEDFDGREPLWIKHCKLCNERDGVS